LVASSRRPLEVNLTEIPEYLPTFSETAELKLDAILRELRNKVLLLGNLNQRQRKLVTHKSKKEYLENEDVRVNIGDADVRLQHIDLMKDMPSLRHSINEVLRLSVQHNEWYNWPKLLAGLHHAKVKLEPDWEAKFVRKALEAGQLPMVLRCLQDVKNTGLTLRNEEVRWRVMQDIRSTAVLTEWDEEVTRKCLYRAQDFNVNMDREEHCGGHATTLDDPRAEPIFMAVPLELACMLSIKYGDGKDEDETVRKYTARLLAALDQQQHDLVSSLSTLQILLLMIWQNPKEPRILSVSDAKLSTLSTKQTYLKTKQLVDNIGKWSPVVHSLQAAEIVTAAAGLSSQLKAIQDACERVKHKVRIANDALSAFVEGKCATPQQEKVEPAT
jgi:hypothetical protein